MSGHQPDAFGHSVRAVQHPALLPWWEACGIGTNHKACLVLWGNPGIRGAGKFEENRTVLDILSKAV